MVFQGSGFWFQNATVPLTWFVTTSVFVFSPSFAPPLVSPKHTLNEVLPPDGSLRIGIVIFLLKCYTLRGQVKTKQNEVYS